MLNKKFSLILCICFLSHAAIASHDLEEAPLRVGYAGKFLKKSRDIYNGGVMLATNLQNFHRQTYLRQSEAKPHEEWFGKVGLKYSCGDFAAFMISDFTADINQKQLNSQRIGLTYRLTPQDIADFQRDILPRSQRGDILSICGLLLQDIMSDATDCTDNGTVVIKDSQGYLDGLAPKVNRVNDEVKKNALIAIGVRLKTLDANEKRMLGDIMTKLVDDNINYYLRQGFLSAKIFGFAESALKGLGSVLGAYASSYFYSSEGSSSYTRMIIGAGMGYGVGKITGGKLKKVGSRLARNAQNYFYYNVIQQNARRIIGQNIVAVDGKKSD